MRESEVRKTVKAFERALRKQLGFVEAYFGLGSAYALLGRMAESVDWEWSTPISNDMQRQPRPSRKPRV